MRTPPAATNVRDGSVQCCSTGLRHDPCQRTTRRTCDESSQSALTLRPLSCHRTRLHACVLPIRPHPGQPPRPSRRLLSPPPPLPSQARLCALCLVLLLLLLQPQCPQEEVWPRPAARPTPPSACGTACCPSLSGRFSVDLPGNGTEKWYYFPIQTPRKVKRKLPGAWFCVSENRPEPGFPRFG